MTEKNIRGNGKITVTCHAGAMHTAENTVKSIKKLIAFDAELVEFDVSFRPDGTPVMIHKDFPKQDEGELISEALKIVAQSRDCKINLDLKSTANLPELEKMIKENGLYDRVFYTGVSADWVEKVKANSTIPYYLNHGISELEATDTAAAQKIADLAKELGTIGVNSRYTGGSRLFSDVMHENGLLVSYWTPNFAVDMRKTISYCPDNITTEFPTKLAKILTCK